MFWETHMRERLVGGAAMLAGLVMMAVFLTEPYRMQSVCKVCKAPLINGGGGTLRAVSKRFDATVENVPVNKCPNGHEGLYWRDNRFGTGFMDALTKEGVMAGGRRTWTLKAKNVCRNCGGDLAGERSARTFEFEFDTETARGRMMKVTITCPALFCGRCERHFMPYDRGELDVYYAELQQALQQAIREGYIV